MTLTRFTEPMTVPRQCLWQTTKAYGSAITRHGGCHESPRKKSSIVYPHENHGLGMTLLLHKPFEVNNLSTRSGLGLGLRDGTQWHAGKR